METQEELVVRPWVRFWARIFDYQVFILIFGTIIYMTVGPILAYSMLMPIMAIFVWCFVEAILIAGIGYTPGKWLLRVKVRSADGEKLSFRASLQRSLSVWWLGYGAGIPILNLITMTVACVKLSNLKMTSWDRFGHFKVSHSKIGFFRILVVFLFFVMITSFVYSSLQEAKTYARDAVEEQSIDATTE